MLHVLKIEVFVHGGGWGGGGSGRWETPPPLSEFSGSAPENSTRFGLTGAK